MAKKQAKQFEVTPSIVVEGAPSHPMNEIINSDEQVIKAIGMVKIPNTNTFVPYVLHIKGTEVVKCEVEEPNLRGIAEESAKINFVNIFMTVEE